MTPDEIDWPPPRCENCRPRVVEGLHMSATHDCQVEPWCECDCPWLWEETP